jgi:hypothetical protein
MPEELQRIVVIQGRSKRKKEKKERNEKKKKTTTQKDQKKKGGRPTSRVAIKCSHHATPQHNNALTLVAFAYAHKPPNSYDHHYQTSIQLRCKPGLSTWQGIGGLLGSSESHVDKAKGGPIRTHLEPFLFFNLNFEVEFPNLRFEGTHGG